jgi:hypothetical protein
MNRSSDEEVEDMRQDGIASRHPRTSFASPSAARRPFAPAITGPRPGAPDPRRRAAALAARVLGTAWLIATAPGVALAPPATVSPGATEGIGAVAERCPTFSWGTVPDAGGYDLAIFDLGSVADETGADILANAGGEVEPAVRVRLPGTAGSWTPSLDRCLLPGRTYAWFLRASGAAASSGWSTARLFRIEAIDHGPKRTPGRTSERSVAPAAARPGAAREDLAAARRTASGPTTADLAGPTPRSRLGSAGAVAERPSFGVSRGNGGFLIAEFKNSNPLLGDEGSALIDLVNGDQPSARWRLGVGGRNNGLGFSDGELYLERYGVGPRFWISGSGTTVVPGKLYVGPVPSNVTTPSFSNGLYVTGSVSGTATLQNHVAAITNTSAAGSADVLALRIGEIGTLSAANNFITFFNAIGESQGAIQGNGAAGVALGGPGADYAEWLEKVDPREEVGPGQVVGLRDSRVGLDTTGAERVMVISTAPIVVGNDPGEDQRHRFARVAFVGQAEVAISGSAQAGDLLVDSGRSDGRAVALPAAEVSVDELPRILGRVLEPGTPGVTPDARVRALVGLPDTALLAVLLGERDRSLGELTERLAALEHLTGLLTDRLAALTAAASQEPTP